MVVQGPSKVLHHKKAFHSPRQHGVFAAYLYVHAERIVGRRKIVHVLGHSSRISRR